MVGFPKCGHNYYRSSLFDNNTFSVVCKVVGALIRIVYIHVVKFFTSTCLPHGHTNPHTSSGGYKMVTVVNSSLEIRKEVNSSELIQWS